MIPHACCFTLITILVLFSSLTRLSNFSKTYTRTAEASNQLWRLRSGVRRTSLILISNFEYASSGTMILILNDELFDPAVRLFHAGLSYAISSPAFLHLVNRELLDS